MDDDRSFVEFTRANYGSLFRTAAMLTGDSATAEDLVQETLTRLYPIWRRVEATENPVAYVRRSVTNGFLTSRRRASATELITQSVPDRATSRDASADVVNRGFAMQLLSRLSERQRAAVVMRFLHDMNDEEIAASIGCRRVTARSLVSRGLAAMRQESDRMDGVQQGLARGSAS